MRQTLRPKLSKQLNKKLQCNTTTVEPQYLKGKDRGNDSCVNEKLFHHFQHAKSQLNSSIYFRVELQQILEFCDLKDTPIFDHADPIIVEVTFSFLKYVLACNNSAGFIEIRVSCPFLTTVTQKLLKSIILNFLEFSSA